MNLSQFKAKLSVGVKIETIHHMHPTGVKRDGDGKVIRNEKGLPVYDPVNLGLSEVARVQSNAFTVWRDHNGEKVESWCNFPKASQCTFNDDGSMTISEEYGAVITYKIVNS